MIWWIALLILIAGGVIGFVICSLLCITAITDRDEQIDFLQKTIKFDELQHTLDRFKEGE